VTLAWVWNSSIHPSPAALNHTRGPMRRGELGFGLLLLFK
jgi:hypothetical protein